FHAMAQTGCRARSPRLRFILRHDRGVATSTLKVARRIGNAMDQPPESASARSVEHKYTLNLAPWLGHLRASLLISTYQAAHRHRGDLRRPARAGCARPCSLDRTPTSIARRKSGWRRRRARSETTRGTSQERRVSLLSTSKEWA